MKLITTEKTSQKLKEIKEKGPSSPKFDYSCSKDLEALYRAFSLDSRAQLDAQTKPILRHSQTTVKYEREEEYKSLIKSNFYRFNEEKQQGKINPVVKYCGNVLFAAIFDALLLKSIEEIFKGKNSVERELGISNKVLKIFGIDPFQLRGFKTFKEKRNYLIHLMNQTIEKLLKNWKEKIDQRDKNAADEEKKREKKVSNFENSFSFLNVRTKYEALKKKLTSTVVQKLNDYENQLKIVQTLKQRQEKRASMQVIHHDELKVNFTNVVKPTYMSSRFSTPNTSLLRPSSSSRKLNANSAKQFNANFMAFNYSSQLQKHNSRNMSTILTSEILEDSLKNKENSRNSGGMSPRRRVFSSHAGLNQYLQETVDKPIEINEKFLKGVLIWDPQLENEFKKAKNQGKKVFFDEVKRNNWDFLAIRNLAQKLFTEEKKHTQRQEKMKKYGEGGYLTAEELKFLADTSELLNACVDKKYLQTAVNIIDENNLHFIELNLAEKIIRKYEEMKEIVTQARLQYFQEKNVYVKEKIEDFSNKKEKENRHLFLSEKSKRYKKMIGTIWQLIEVKNHEKQEKEDEEIIEEMILKNFSAKFKKNLSVADLLRRREAKKNREKLERDVIKKPHYQNLISELKNPLVIKHKFHPASKLHKLDPDEKMSKPPQYFHNLDNIEQEYRISIKCPGTIRVPHNFAKFYSGGPQINQSFHLYNPSSGTFGRAPNALELKAIIHIQSRLRGHLARALFKRLLENHRNKKFVEAQERIVSKHTQKLQKQKESGDESPLRKSFSPTSFYNKKIQQIKDLNQKKPLYPFSCKSILSEDQNLDTSREKRIRNREPPKSLLLKHRKLLEAAVKDNFFMVKNSGFIYYPNDVNIKDKNGNSALFYTALNANMEFSKFLLKTGGKVNLSCSEGNTPLHMAFKSNDLNIIMTLIEKGGDLNVLNHYSQTPLAFGSRYILEVLDLTSGIATCNSKNIDEINFDNNKLLYKVPHKERVLGKQDLMFKFEELRRMTTKIIENGKVMEFNKSSLEVKGEN